MPHFPQVKSSIKAPNNIATDKTKSINHEAICADNNAQIYNLKSCKTGRKYNQI